MPPTSVEREHIFLNAGGAKAGPNDITVGGCIVWWKDALDIVEEAEEISDLVGV